MRRRSSSIARGMVVVAILAANFAAFKAFSDHWVVWMVYAAPMFLALHFALLAAVLGRSRRRAFWASFVAAGSIWPAVALPDVLGCDRVVDTWAWRNVVGPASRYEIRAADVIGGAAAADGTWAGRGTRWRLDKIDVLLIAGSLTPLAYDHPSAYVIRAAITFLAQLPPTLAVALAWASAWSRVRPALGEPGGQRRRADVV